MAQSALNYFDTGIPELNDLLTRDSKKGIAIPEAQHAPSSTLVIKGSTGAGKSVLGSIIAYNLHYRLTKMANNQWSLPFAFYFSFAQPSKGLRVYIDTILQPPASKHKPYPLILSPRSFRGKPETGGIEMLRRNLLNNLAAIDCNELDKPLSWNEAHERLEKCFRDFTESQNWHIEPKSVEEVLQKSPTEGTIAKNDSVTLTPLIIVDPVNFFFDYRDSRFAVAELFETFRTLRWPLILTLEDAGEESSEAHRQLMSHVEFESDVILRLAAHRQAYTRFTIQVTKNRNSQPHFGPHMFRIEKPSHSLWNIPSTWGDPPPVCPPANGSWLKILPDEGAVANDSANHPGFLIFKSIHWHLSESRHRDMPESKYHSGLSQLDKILEKGVADSMRPALLPPDAFILVHGKKGGHKLSVAFNILAAGLWNRRLGNSPNRKISQSNSVMLLSMGEETRIQVNKIALAYPDEPEGSSLYPDNGKQISCFEDHYETGNVGDKIMLHEWCWKRPDSNDKWEESRLIEVTFEPGYLSVDEFLWAIRQLENHFKPSRILLDNTAHLHLRFPELQKERMLFPALSSFAECQQVMLIVIDVEGEGSNEEVSYGLKASADYLINLEEWDFRQFFESIKAGIQPLDPSTFFNNQGRQVEGRMALMNVRNVRGKNYTEMAHPIRVDGIHLVLGNEFKRVIP